MKKIVFIFALVFIAVSTTEAQDTRYGFKAGVNFSDLDGDAVPDADGRTGVAVGFFAEVGLSNKLAFQPEFLYSAQGSKTEELRVDYLQLPLLLKLELTSFLNLYAGPQVGVKIHEFEDGYNNFDYTALGGVGFDLNDNFSIEGRYAFGLSDVLDNDLDAKNKYIQILVAFRL